MNIFGSIVIFNSIRFFFLFSFFFFLFFICFFILFFSICLLNYVLAIQSSFTFIADLCIKLIFIIFALCLLYYDFDKLQFAKSKVMRHFKRSLITLNFRKYNKILLYSSFTINFHFLSACQDDIFPNFAGVQRDMNKKLFFLTKNIYNKNPHIYRVSHDQL